MFRFANPEYLYLLIIVPILAGLFVFISKYHTKRLRLFGEIALIQPLMSEASWLRVKSKYFFMVIAITMIIVAIARPQVGSKLREVKKKGVEIILAVDISNSMLTEDFKPSRLERTKFAINQLIDKLQSDRIGLVVFAGDAYVQLPITSDGVSAKKFVNYIDPSIVSAQGTSISKALELSGRSFSEQSEKSRAIILISDGEDHENDPMPIVKRLTEQGIIIHSVGIGTPEGAAITIGGEMIKDENGTIVVSKLNEELLQEIAVSSGGSYIRATNQSIGLDQIIKQIRSMEAQEFNSMTFDEYNEQFQLLLGLALLILMIEFVTLERKNRIIERMTLFHKKSDTKKKLNI